MDLHSDSDNHSLPLVQLARVRMNNGGKRIAMQYIQAHALPMDYE